MKLEDVQKLALLARIEVSEQEQQEFLDDLTSILSYVDQVSSISTDGLSDPEYPLRNVMRSDTDAHESGMYTEKILAQAPDHDVEYVKVQKIL